MRMDDATGYLEPATRRGFNAEMKETFIKRFKVCSNRRGIARSINVDIQSVYDAIALDKKFREEFIKADAKPRTTRLTNELEKLAASEKTQVVEELASKINKYK